MSPLLAKSSATPTVTTSAAGCRNCNAAPDHGHHTVCDLQGRDHRNARRREAVIPDPIYSLNVEKAYPFRRNPLFRRGGQSRSRWVEKLLYSPVGRAEVSRGRQQASEDDLGGMGGAIR